MSRKGKTILLAAGGALVLCVVCLLLFGRYKPDGLADHTLQGNTEQTARLWGPERQGIVLFSEDSGRALAPGQALTGEVTLPEAGEYLLYVRYRIPEQAFSELTFQVDLGAQTASGALPAVWSEKGTARPLDRYGDELNAQAEMAAYPVTGAMLQKNDVGARGLRLSLEAGTQAYSLSCDRAVELYGVRLVPAAQSQTGALETALSGEGSALVSLEAENYAMKSNSYIRGKNVKNAALSPYNTYQEKINVIDAQSWSTVGQRILWVAQVDTAGWYRIGFRYSQYSDANKHSYRTLEIDGQPVTASPVAFPGTGMNSYQNLTVQENGQDLWVYLTAGQHAIAMEAVMDPLMDSYEELVALMNEINAICMDLRKLTAGNQDPNRTWDMDQYLPEVPGRLQACKDRIEALYGALRAVEGREPAYANRLLYGAQQIENLLEDKRLIPNKAGMLSEGDGSVNSALGEILEKLVQQPLSLDRIYLYQNVSLPASRCNPLVHVTEGAKRLAETYLPGAGGADYTADGGDSDELQVWVNMSVSYAEVLQQLVDEQYNAQHGTRIEIALMPNDQKLILSNAAGKSPDVVLGVSFFTPYELAIRGAAKNLLEYEDFASFYASQYNVAGLTPLAYDGGIYGAVDSLNFQILFYRKDILDSLGLSVPQTWTDVQNMMPELLRYSMNFYSSLASGSSFKTFNMTGPFMYQNGASFYAADGSHVAFNEEQGQKALQQMTDLFRVYSLTSNVANFFNSFRYGETPLGVGNFSTYVQLSTAAPELEGRWGVALVPGTRQPDGSIDYCQAADSTASMIFKNTDQPEESWEFLKWWLSSGTQAEFSNRMESAYGSAYRWNTANLKAFDSLPYDPEDKAVILEQLSYQRETLRHPAGYMVEREVSNIWNQVVVNGKGLTESIDRAAIASDREIIRKLQEFGFMDENGKLIKPYTTEDILSWMGLGEEETAHETQ